MTMVFAAISLALGAALWWYAPVVVGLIGLDVFGEAAQLGVVLLGLSAVEAVLARFR